MWIEDLKKILQVMEKLEKHTERRWKYDYRNKRLVCDYEGMEIYIQPLETKFIVGSSFLPEDPIKSSEKKLISNYREIKRQLEDYHEH
jgi:hypothetical protein